MKIGDIRWVELPDVGGREQLRFAGTAQVKATDSSGLRTDSVALVFQIRAIDRGRIKEAIGTVSILELAEIRAELAKLFGS